MTSARVNRVVAAVIAGSMFFSSTGAVAATAQSAAPQQVSPWVALSALTAGAPAAALCGAAAAATAAQAPATGCVLPAVDAPPPVADAGPPPPVPVPAVAAPSSFAISPLFLALGALAAGALIYFVVRKHHHDVSPA
ncbi:hypothetical protein ACUXST_000432 [Sphingomonas sp. F9_3S_D5_B_2]